MNAEVALPEPARQVEEVHVFDESSTQGDIIAELATRIPQNEYGLPLFFIRCDLLHGTQLTDSDIEAASVYLTYAEGYPTLPNGVAFWSQLPHEPQSEFEYFQAFIDQPEEIGIRQPALLADMGDYTPEQIMEMSKKFFWSARARAYDLFIVAAEAKRRQHRIRKMENQHFDRAGALLDRLVDRFAGEDEDWIEELNAKEAIEVLDTLISIQRKSVGLTGQHASSTAKEFAPGQSPQEILRQLAQQSGGSDNRNDFASRLAALVDDAENGMVLQEAIIKVSKKDRLVDSDGME